MKKYPIFLSENFQLLEVKFSIYLNRRVSVMMVLNYICHSVCIIRTNYSYQEQKKKKKKKKKKKNMNIS